MACALVAVAADDAVAPLAERLLAAPIVAEGEAGRPYAAWNGTDPATIVTYTPFSVHRVYKGQLAGASILLRVPGGEVGGVHAPADPSTEFAEGEREVVLLGERDPKDGSYSMAMSRGSYRVTRDAHGIDGLDVHLGVDAGTYPSRERGSGTASTHVPLERIEHLASGEPAESGAAPSKMIPAGPAASSPPGASVAPNPPRRACGTGCIAAVLALIVAGAVLLWRRRKTR